MVREQITVRNPAVDVFLLPTHKKLPGYLSIPEQEKVLGAFAQDPTPLGFRDYALVATGLLTGLRCSELSHLQLGHLNLEAGILRVVDGKGRKDRELPIIPRLERILRPYLEVTRPGLLALPAGYIKAPRAANRARSWVARAGSREEAERLRAAAIPSNIAANPYVFVRGGRAVAAEAWRGVARAPDDLHHDPAPVRGGAEPEGPPAHAAPQLRLAPARERGRPDLQDIQEALGHAVITTTTMYAHLTTRRQREKLAKYLK